MVATVAIVLVLLRSCVAITYLIPSSGMEPTLHQGDRIVVSRWSYGLRLPLSAWIGVHRWASRTASPGDVMVFNDPLPVQATTPISRRATFVSRCMAAPGDTVWVRTASEVADNTATTSALPTAPAIAFTNPIPPSAEGEATLGEDSAALHKPQWQPIVIPGRNTGVAVTPYNAYLLRNTLVMHEGRQAQVRGDTLLVDGQPTTRCTFTQDYYWVMSDHPDCPCDSRLFGLVPHSHLIGRPVWKVPIALDN